MLSVGCSDYTFIKQGQFARIINRLLNRYNRKKEEDCSNFLYIDINAGPGIHPKYGKGSPLIFLEAAKSKKVNCNALLFEEDATISNELRNNITKYHEEDGNKIIIRNEHNGNLTPSLISSISTLNTNHKISGLFYSDANGVPAFDVITRFSKSRQYSDVDILINCNCGAVKRVRTSSKDIVHPTLKEYIGNINRKKWYIYTVRDSWQWALLFGTNNERFNRHSFLMLDRLDTPIGEEAFKRMNLTEKEMQSQASSKQHRRLRIILPKVRYKR